MQQPEQPTGDRGEFHPTRIEIPVFRCAFLKLIRAVQQHGVQRRQPHPIPRLSPQLVDFDDLAGSLVRNRPDPVAATKIHRVHVTT